MKLFVVFGSKSDEMVYGPLCEGLGEAGHEVSFEVISAHRNPLELGEALENRDYDAVVAGAGLAAHLPGVVASKINKPVFGVPVAAHFAGLDSLFSIFQMPFGVPVISAVPNKEMDIALFLQGMKGISKEKFLYPKLVVDPVLLDYEYVNLELARAKEYLQKQGGEWEVISSPIVGEANICMVDNIRHVYLQENTSCIHVPVIEKSILGNPARALELFRVMEGGGLWVGVNNTRNAIGSFIKLAQISN